MKMSGGCLEVIGTVWRIGMMNGQGLIKASGTHCSVSLEMSLSMALYPPECCSQPVAEQMASSGFATERGPFPAQIQAGRKQDVRKSWRLKRWLLQLDIDGRNAFSKEESAERAGGRTNGWQGRLMQRVCCVLYVAGPQLLIKFK